VVIRDGGVLFFWHGISPSEGEPFLNWVAPTARTYGEVAANDVEKT
jgi:hypothetical protein